MEFSSDDMFNLLVIIGYLAGALVVFKIEHGRRHRQMTDFDSKRSWAELKKMEKRD